MLPIIAIVGRPNVGKSTLFNRMVGERRAIVDDQPGVTRDRQYCVTTFQGRSLSIVDTGGFEPVPDSDLFSEMRQQALIALEEADVILFVVDRQVGCTPADRLTADILRKTVPAEHQDKLHLIVNKCDGPRHEIDAVEFYELGFAEMLCISAEHGRNIYELWDIIVGSLPEHSAEELSEEDDGWLISDEHLVESIQQEIIANSEPDAGRQSGHNAVPLDSDVMALGGEVDADAWQQFYQQLVNAETSWSGQDLAQDEALSTGPEFPEELRVAVLGRPNIGKSTLINRLIGENRHVVCDLPGTTMDSIDSTIELEEQFFRFVDTAGIRRKARISERVEGFAVSRAIRTIERCHICMLMIDGTIGVTKQDARLAALIADRGRACILLINKWDLVKQDPERNSAIVHDEIVTSLPHLSWAKVIYLSALTGKGCHRIVPALKETYLQFNSRIPTSQLNRFLSEIVARTPPPQKHHHRVRFNYVTQARVRPPTFVIWGNSPDAVPPSYRRFLENQMRRAFGFAGTPIRIHLRRKRKQWEERS